MGPCAWATILLFLLSLSTFFTEARGVECSSIALHKRTGETNAAVEKLCRMASHQSE